jgi:putative phage-type endonuclease
MNAVSVLTLSPSRGYIGGGNVAGILGCSPYKSPLDEFLVITGQADDVTAEREAFFERRKGLEPWAGKVFERRTGIKVVARNVRYTDDEFDFLRAEIDFETDDGGNGETKTVHPLAARDWGDSDTDDMPVYVTAQAMHGLMVTGRQFAWIHALIGFDDDRVYRVDRDDETIAAIRQQEVTFWNDHILPLAPPEPKTLDDLKRLFPRDVGTSIEADGSALEAYNRLRELKAQAKPLEAEIEAAETAVKLILRDASALTLDGKSLLTWKAQSANRFDQKAFAASYPELFEQFKTTTEMRVLRVR